MTIVFDTLLLPGSEMLLPGIVVSVRLNTIGFTDGTIIGSRQTITDIDTADYSFDLVPNSQIDPVGTAYEMILPNGIVLAFVVPDGAGPYRLRDILVQFPEPPYPIEVGVTPQDLDNAVQEAINEHGTLPSLIDCGGAAESSGV